MILEFVRSMGPEVRQKTKDAWAEIHALDALIKRPPEIKSREELIEKIKDFNDMHERIKKINALKPALFSKKFFYKLSRSMDNLANFDKEERASAIEDKFKRPLESQKRATRYLGEYFHLNATVLHRDIVRHDLPMTALAKEAGIKRELFDKFDSLLISLKEVETKAKEFNTTLKKRELDSTKRDELNSAVQQQVARIAVFRSLIKGENRRHGNEQGPVGFKCFEQPSVNEIEGMKDGMGMKDRMDRLKVFVSRLNQTYEDRSPNQEIQHQGPSIRISEPDRPSQSVANADRDAEQMEASGSRSQRLKPAARRAALLEEMKAPIDKTVHAILR